MHADQLTWNSITALLPFIESCSYPQDYSAELTAWTPGLFNDGPRRQENTPLRKWFRVQDTSSSSENRHRYQHNFLALRLVIMLRVNFLDICFFRATIFHVDSVRIRGQQINIGTVFLILPITMAARSEAWNVFVCSNTGIAGSNSIRFMDGCVYSVCVVLCR
jgi:hypothetical protein